MVVYTYHKNIPESQNVLLNIIVSVQNFSSFPSASVQGQFEDLAPFFIVNYLRETTFLRHLRASMLERNTALLEDSNQLTTTRSISKCFQTNLFSLSSFPAASQVMSLYQRVTSRYNEVRICERTFHSRMLVYSQNLSVKLNMITWLQICLYQSQ